MYERLRVLDETSAAVTRRTAIAEAIRAPRFLYSIECRDLAGVLRWREDVANLVTTQGKNDLLAKYFKGSGYTAAWYVGLIDSVGFSSVDENDTPAAHVGWVENTAAYSNSTRPSLVLGTPAGGSVDNGDSLATFAIVGTATIQGSFVVSQSTKGGTGGILYSASAFGISRAVLNGDSLTVKTTLNV